MIKNYHTTKKAIDELVQNMNKGKSLFEVTAVVSSGVKTSTTDFVTTNEPNGVITTVIVITNRKDKIGSEQDDCNPEVLLGMVADRLNQL